MNGSTSPVKCLGSAFRPAGAGIPLLLASLVAFVGLGCGGGSSNVVTGKVTYKNQPVAGSLVFVGPDGKETPEPINPDGTYIFKAPATGEYKIAVKSFLTSVGPGGQGPAVGVPKMSGQGTDLPSTGGVAPPKKYASADNGLKVNVTGGSQTHDIELQP
jgi:hypothetical protein